MTKKRQTYTREFKLKAVDLWQTSGKSAAQIEHELDIGGGCLYRWKRKLAEEDEKQQLAQDLKDEREEKRKLAERLETAESENQRLEDEKQQLAQELQALTERLQSVEGEREGLRQELDMYRSDREVLSLEVNQVKEKAEREKLEYGLRSAKELSPLLGDLSDLSGLEPKSVKGLRPRSVFEKLKAWMEQATGERLVSFPSQSEIQANHTFYLDPDEGGIEALMEVYDWYPDHPFEGLPVGERRRRFRILRRGWRVEKDILIRAQVAVEDENGNAGE